MISRIFRPIKEGFRGVGRHGAMSFSAASAVTITLVIISLFMLFTMNMNQVTSGLEQSIQISVMVDYDYESAEQEDRISLAIQDIPEVTNVTYYTKDQEYQYYMDSFTDEKTRELMTPFEGEFEGDDNPFHDSFYVEISDGTKLKQVADQISEIEGVSAVNFGGMSATELVSVLRTIRYGGLILALSLSILAIFLIQNTIKLTILARADEIAIMRNVGATNNFIRSPFVVEGIIIGALGSIVPMVLTYYGYRYLYQYTGGYVITQMFSLIPPETLVWKVNGVLLLTGMIVGLIGSFFSVTKYLRWKR